MKHFLITDKSENKVSENMTEDCMACYAKCNTPGLLIHSCPKYGGQRRQGLVETSKNSAFLCCHETKTTKLFRQKLEALSYAFSDLIIPKKEIEESIKKTEQQKVNRLVHNLTSINAHNIQEIYDLIPQEVLTFHWRDQLEFIEKEIRKTPEKAAMTFLRIAKHNIHMKSEFSIYRKLDREDNVALDFRSYSIRNVLLNVLHTFFVDFSNNSIYVNVKEYYGKVLIDYETIQVAIYHLIENASKYTKPSSIITIDFEENEVEVYVKFNMTSIYINPDERELIFQEGYSGENAKVLKKHGDGIGLWRIRQMMEINKGICHVIAGEAIETYHGTDFSKNMFILKFNKYHPNN